MYQKTTVPEQKIFIQKLSKSLGSIRTSIATDQSYTQQEICTAIPDEPTKQNYVTITQINHINLDMDYAGDVSKVSSKYNDIRKFKEEAPKVLLSIGQEYEINKNNNWNNVSYFGSLLDTIKDIKRRKTLTITAANSAARILKKKRITRTSKMQVFKIYIQSIFCTTVKFGRQKKL